MADKIRASEITDITIEIREDVTVRFFDCDRLVLTRTWETSGGGYKCKEKGTIEKALRGLGISGNNHDFYDGVEHIEGIATELHHRMMLGVC